jgi:cyanate permease
MSGGPAQVVIFYLILAYLPQVVKFVGIEEKKAGSRHSLGKLSGGRGGLRSGSPFLQIFPQ